MIFNRPRSDFQNVAGFLRDSLDKKDKVRDNMCTLLQQNALKL